MLLFTNLYKCAVLTATSFLYPPLDNTIIRSKHMQYSQGNFKDQFDELCGKTRKTSMPTQYSAIAEIFSFFFFLSNLCSVIESINTLIELMSISLIATNSLRLRKFLGCFLAIICVIISFFIDNWRECIALKCPLSFYGNLQEHFQQSLSKPINRIWCIKCKFCNILVDLKLLYLVLSPAQYRLIGY